MRNLLLLIALVTATAGLDHGLAARQARAQGEIKPFMQAKLEHSQEALKSLTLEDFASLEKQARKIALLSQAAAFRVIDTDEYRLQSTQFRRAAEQLATAAEKEALDASDTSLCQHDAAMRRMSQVCAIGASGEARLLLADSALCREKDQADSSVRSGFRSYRHLNVNPQVESRIRSELNVVRCPSNQSRNPIMASSIYERKVKDVMSRDVVAIHHQDTVHEALTLMTENRVNALPVIDGHERCVGMLSTTDMMDLTREMEHDLAEAEVAGATYLHRIGSEVNDQVGQQLVRELMTDSPATVGLETPLYEAASLMRRQRVHRLPVIDDGKHLRGILSTMDVLDAFIDGAPQ